MALHSTCAYMIPESFYIKTREELPILPLTTKRPHQDINIFIKISNIVKRFLTYMKNFIANIRLHLHYFTYSPHLFSSGYITCPISTKQTRLCSKFCEKSFFNMLTKQHKKTEAYAPLSLPFLTIIEDTINIKATVSGKFKLPTPFHCEKTTSTTYENEQSHTTEKKIFKLKFNPGECNYEKTTNGEIIEIPIPPKVLGQKETYFIRIYIPRDNHNKTIPREQLALDSIDVVASTTTILRKNASPITLSLPPIPRYKSCRNHEIKHGAHCPLNTTKITYESNLQITNEGISFETTIQQVGTEKNTSNPEKNEIEQPIFIGIYGKTKQEPNTLIELQRAQIDGKNQGMISSK